MLFRLVNVNKQTNRYHIRLELYQNLYPSNLNFLKRASINNFIHCFVIIAIPVHCDGYGLMSNNPQTPEHKLSIQCCVN